MAVELQDAAARPGTGHTAVEVMEVAQNIGIMLIMGSSVGGVLVVFGAPSWLAGSFGLAAAAVPLVIGLVARSEEPETS